MSNSSNITALLRSVRADQAQQTSTSDESLNAGAELPGDELNKEVKVPTSAVADLLPAEDLTDAATALESRHKEFSYLRDDILVAGGMNQQLAQEGLNIDSTFNRSKPIGYYSKHTTSTQYIQALESVDQAMRSDLIRYLENVQGMASRVVDSAKQWSGSRKDNWSAVNNALNIVFAQMAGATDFLNVKGAPWDEVTLIAKAINGPFGADVKPLISKLQLAHGKVRAIFDQELYYLLGQQQVQYIDVILTHCDAWEAAVVNYTEMLKASNGKYDAKFEMPTPLSITLPDGRSVNFDQFNDTLSKACQDAIDYEPKNGSPLTIYQAIDNAWNASRFSNMDDLFGRMQILTDKVEHYRAVVTDLFEAVCAFDQNSDAASNLVTDVNKFATKLFDVYTNLLYMVDKAAIYECDFRQMLREILITTLVMVETQDAAMQSTPGNTLLVDPDYDKCWAARVQAMRETVAGI